MTDSPEIQIPRYKCHKEVHALQISRVEFGTMYFVDKNYAPKRATSDLFARYMPKQGDYYVVYEDGYESISPKKAFEDGYTLIKKNT